MSKEIELKLAIAPEHATLLKRHPLLRKVKSNTQHLVNTYYDSPDFILKLSGYVLRIRETGNKKVQTIKTAIDDGQGGLHERDEWETELTSNTPDFDAFPDDMLKNELIEDGLAKQIQPLFKTEFDRTNWVIHPTPETCLIISLDQGNITAGENKSRISEVEIELANGEDTTELYKMANILSHKINLKPLDTSKATIGYELVSINR
jgi:triphosphatase